MMLEHDDRVEIYDKYIAECEEKTRRNPNDPQAWAELGQSLQSHDVQWHEGGKLQPRALQAFEKSLHLRPTKELVSLSSHYFVYFVNSALTAPRYFTRS